MRTDTYIATLTALAICCLASSTPAHAQSPRPLPQQVVPVSRIHLPILFKNGGYASSPPARPDPCSQIPGETYVSLSITGPVTNRPADAHPDLNLAIRGYVATKAPAQLVDYGTAPSDARAPQLAGLLGGRLKLGSPIPFAGMAQVHDWTWATGQRGAVLQAWPVTLAGLATLPGDTVHVPAAGYDIGSGLQVLVLYATSERVTLKYTREDNVVAGYTLHLEGVCVEPRLRALYEQLNAAGRHELPALRPGQALGRARGTQLDVAIRDTGTFMDPRSRLDWWHGW
jgi:hypothetical protein